MLSEVRPLPQELEPADFQSYLLVPRLRSSPGGGSLADEEPKALWV